MCYNGRILLKGNFQMKQKLWNKNFILLLQGNAISTLGDVMYGVAIGYWVYTQTGSTALMGVMSSLSMFVTMFLSPFCGSIVDKCNRRWLIVGIDLMQGILMLSVGVLAYLNALNVPIVLVVAFLASFGSVFYSPAISTIMLDIIPREDMTRGQSAYSGITSLINLVGSAFSGAMVAFFGVPLIVVLNGISNLYSAVTECFVSVPKTAGEDKKVSIKGVIADMISAVKSIFSDACLKIFVPCVLVLNLLSAGPLALTLPFCLEKGFTVDMYGYLVSVYSVAFVVGALILGAVKLSPRARYYVMGIGFVLSVPCFVLTYCVNDFLLMCVLGFFAGLLNCAGNTVFSAAMMLALPEDNRSAILGFISSASVGGSALSALLYGFLGEVVPLYIIFALGNVISLPLMCYLSFHRQTKQFILEHCE